MKRRNLLLCVDSYKSSHFLQYPPGMDGLFSYFESRGGKYDETVFFGLQGIIREYLLDPIDQQDIDEAEAFFKAHGEPFNREGWEHILTAHNGFMPVRIMAPPEGTVIPNHNVLMTVESTDPKVPWIVNYLETLLVRLWYPITVATISWNAKKSILEFLYRTSDDLSEIHFKLHDFGARGVSSGESAAIGGAAHLVNFMGSDTVEGVLWAQANYGAAGGMPGFSIPAAEHSTITSWGKEDEVRAYENMLKQFAKPGSLVACVSDSYDLWNAIDQMWGGELRQKVIDSGATVIIRPDSGDPASVVKKTLQMLESKFGSKRNTKGYRVLNNVRVIQGDGINPSSITEILTHAAAAGFSATNIAFGMGGGLLQQLNRDTQRFAFKASAIHYPDKGWVGFNKDPVTDPGKASKAGRLMLYRTGGGGFATSNPGPWSDHSTDALVVKYDESDRWSTFSKNIKFESLDEIRERAFLALDKVVYKGIH